MPTFRRIDASQAGPSALGILVPPGEPTVVIVRPRSLAWDLLPARWNGDAAQPPAFCQFGRDEAAQAARRLVRCLEQAASSGSQPVETFGDGHRFQVWLRTEEFFWILCRRTPGEAYQPLIFASQKEAELAAESLLPVLCPGPATEQEYYFNTQKLSAGRRERY